MSNEIHEIKRQQKNQTLIEMPRIAGVGAFFNQI
jgi:hypothetical protein